MKLTDKEESELELAIKKWQEDNPGEEWPYVDVWGRPKMAPDVFDMLNLLDEEERKRRETEEAAELERLKREAEDQLVKGLNWPLSLRPENRDKEGNTWKLRSYQLAGAVHLRKTKRGMLYDQPGLGKTVQGSMALTVPAIISCPGYLVDQWADFLANEYPDWKVARIHSLLGRYERQALLDQPHDIYIVNHEMWAARIPPFNEKRPKKSDPDYTEAKMEQWKEGYKLHRETATPIRFKWPKVTCVVVDEAHHFRNKDASQSEELREFCDTIPNVILLTATPQYRDAKDWWHQLRLMDPREYSWGRGNAYRLWVDRYTYTSGWNDSITKVRPSMVDPLQEEIKKYALGRSYEDVGMELPPLIEKVVTVPFHPDVLKLYKDIKEQYKVMTSGGNDVTIDPGEVLHLLRTITACPEKVEAVRNIIDDLPQDDRPIIVGCWYRDTADLLAKEFELSPSSVRIHGADSQRVRLQHAADLRYRIKCVTMSSASEGVDWSDAVAVVCFEEDYTPGRMYQFLSRVRRFSPKGVRTDPVLVYYVHMRASVDVNVHEAVTERQGDARRILRRALK